MSILKAVILGIVQGIAEFLPVSSSGHLAIVSQVLHVQTDTGLLFEVMLHFGTLVAIFAAMYKDVWKLIVNGVGIVVDACYNLGMFVINLFTHAGRRYRRILFTSYRKLVMLIIVSTIPTGIIGVLMSDVVDAASETLIIPGICLVITGCLLMIADNCHVGVKRAAETGYLDSVVIGTAQGIATLPGLSRSGTTITVAMLCGLDKTFAVKYSFLMSIPAVLGAVVLELKDLPAAASSKGDLPAYCVGMVVAGIVGYISIKLMLGVVRKHKFTGFAIYCLAIGAFAVVWALTR